MTFRDDREALAERAAGLERDLADAQRDLLRSGIAAETVTRLEREIAALRRERDGLRTGTEPARRGLTVGLALATACLVIAVIGLVVVTNGADDTTEMANAQREQLRAEAAELERQLAVSQAAEEATARELAMARARLEEPPPPRVDVTVSVHHASSFLTDARVVRATGEAPAHRGDACSVSITVDQDGECRAEVLCGEHAVYPINPEGGYFRCELDDDEHVVRGADMASTSLDADPRFDFDRERGIVVVEDGPSPAWSLAIRFGS